MKKAKTCPVCGSNNLKWMYYAPPANDAPELWDFDEYGFNPLIIAKRIECRKCGATVSCLTLTIDDAIDAWNELNGQGQRYVLQRIGEENVNVMDVEVNT